MIGEVNAKQTSCNVAGQWGRKAYRTQYHSKTLVWSMSSYLLYYFHLANRKRKLCKLLITVFDHEFKQKVTGVLGNERTLINSRSLAVVNKRKLCIWVCAKSWAAFFFSQERESGPSDPPGSISIIFFASFSRTKLNQGPLIGILIESVVPMSRS